MTSLAKTLGVLACVAGCAGTQVPPARFAQTQSAISAADAVGAQHEPRAALHLKMARDQFNQAQALSKDGEEEEAELVLRRANVDAEMALMVTREANARRAAEQAQQEVQALKPQQ